MTILHPLSLTIIKQPWTGCHVSGKGRKYYTSPNFCEQSCYSGILDQNAEAPVRFSPLIPYKTFSAIQEQPNIRCSQKFRNIHWKTPVLESLFMSLLKKDSKTGVLLWILRKVLEDIFWKPSVNCCFWQFLNSVELQPRIMWRFSQIYKDHFANKLFSQFCWPGTISSTSGRLKPKKILFRISGFNLAVYHFIGNFKKVIKIKLIVLLEMIFHLKLGSNVH